MRKLQNTIIASSRVYSLPFRVYVISRYADNNCNLWQLGQGLIEVYGLSKDTK